MDLGLWEGFVFGGLYFVPSPLTFLFCCTVLDVVFAKWGKHKACEFLSMVYFYGSVVGGRVWVWRTVLCAMGSLTFVFCCTVSDVVFAIWGETHSL